MDDQIADREGGGIKFRRLRIAWSVVCGILCLLLIVLWVRSYWWDDLVEGPILWPHGCSLTSTGGRLMLCGMDEDDPVTYWSFLSIEASSRYAIRKQFLGPVFAFHPSQEGGSYIHVPHWFLAIISAAMSILLAKQWRFSLRTLLIVITLVTVGLGLIAYYLTHAKPGGGGVGGGGLASDCRGKELPTLPRLI